METKFIKALVGLGIPGVALGVCYLLLRQFGFSFDTIPPMASAGIAVLFLLVVAVITLFALNRWAPRPPDLTPPEAYNFTIVEDWTFRDTISAMVKDDNATVEFHGFSNDELNARLEGRELHGKDLVEAIVSAARVAKTNLGQVKVTRTGSLYRVQKQKQ